MIDYAVMLFSSGYKKWVTVCSFRRRWPHTWAIVQKNQIVDMDDGHYNRPWLTAPKLGLFYKSNHQAIIFKVRPAKGSNLQVLQEQVSDLAAQFKNVDSFEVGYAKPSDYRGDLKLLLQDNMAEVKTPVYRKVKHASVLN